MTLRNQTIITYKVYVERDFDLDVRVHPRIQDLFDQELSVIPPSYTEPDVFVFTLRDTQYLEDVEVFSKTETKSLFQVHDFRKETSRAYAIFVGRELTTVADTAKAINKPLADVRIIKSIHDDYVSVPESDNFIPLQIDPLLWETKNVSDLESGISFTVSYFPKNYDHLINCFTETNLYQLFRTNIRSACPPVVIKIKTTDNKEIHVNACYQITCVAVSLYSRTYQIKIKPITQRTPQTGIHYVLAVDGEVVAASGTPSNYFAPYGEVVLDLYLERGIHILTFRSAHMAQGIGEESVPLCDACLLYLGDEIFSVDSAYTQGLRIYALPFGTKKPMTYSLQEEIMAPSAVDILELSDALAQDFPVTILLRGGSESIAKAFAETKVHENDIAVGKVDLNTEREIIRNIDSFEERPHLWAKAFTRILSEGGINKEASKAIILSSCISPCGESRPDCDGDYVSYEEGSGVLCSSNEAIVITRGDNIPLSFRELNIAVQLFEPKEEVIIFLHFEEPEVKPDEIITSITYSEGVTGIEADLDDPSLIRLKVKYHDLSDLTDYQKTTIPAIYTLKFSKQIKCQRISAFVRETAEEPNGSWRDLDKVRININVADHLGEFCLVTTKKYIQKLSKADVNNASMDIDDITIIPAIFKPENLRQDVKYLTDYIIFGIRGTKPDFQIYGPYYKIINQNEYSETGAVCLSFYGTAIQTKENKGVFADIDKTIPLQWAYALYDHENETFIPSDLNSLEIKLVNTAGTDVTNPTVEFYLPNYGHGWTCPDGNTCGITKDGAKTTDPQQWTWIRFTYSGTISANGEVSLTFSKGDFSDTANVGDTITPEIVAKPILSSLHAILVNTTLIPGENAFYFLEDDTNPPDVSATYDLLKGPVLGRVFIRNTYGNETPFELLFDLTDLLGRYGRIPLRAINARTKEPLATIGIDRFGVPSPYFLHWKSTKIAIKGTLPPEGMLIDFVPGEFDDNPEGFMGETKIGLISLYHLGDENLNDSSGRNWHGELFNCTPSQDKNGTANKATNFTGASYGVIPHIILSPTYAVSVWFKTSNDGGITCISKDLGPSSQTDCDLYIEGGVIKHNYKGNVLATSTIITDGNWHHVVVSISPFSGRRIYLDGNLIAQDTNTDLYKGFDADYTTTLVGFANNTYFVGDLDELRIYVRDLAPPIVKHLYRIFDLYVPNRTQFRWRDFQNDGLLLIRPHGIATSLYDTLQTTGQAYWIYKYAGISGVIKQLVT